MPAGRAETQVDVRVAGDLRVVERLRRDERVVRRGDDEGGDRNAVDDAHRAGAGGVVLAGAGTAGRGGRRADRVGRRGDDEGGDRNAVDDAHRAGAVVVVLGVAETEVRRGVRLVEL